MTYKESIEYIQDAASSGCRLGLDNIRALMSLLGDPQERLRVIHIAGTNGKGSVAAFILSIMKESGYRMGFFTSPELYRFSEKIRINGEEISDDDVAKYATKVRKSAEYMKAHDLGCPSEFELVLAMAFCYFKDQNVDGVILEVGLGGRLDATNVINSSVLSVITKISYDHMQYLGDTLAGIASEKAAIIKPHGRVIVYPADSEVMEVFKKQCREQEAELHIAELPDETGTLRAEAGYFVTGREFTVSGQKFVTGMIGIFETENAALAIQAVRLLGDGQEGIFNISEESIYEGIRSAVWPGRFEVLSHDPLIIADGAHNEDGAKALEKTLREYFGEKKLTLCTGILRDKEYEKMLAHLLPLSDRVIVCEVPNPRSLKADELACVIRSMSANTEIIASGSVEDAYLAIKKLQYQSDTAAIIICGSLYLVGPMRELVLAG